MRIRGYKNNMDNAQRDFADDSHHKIKKQKWSHRLLALALAALLVLPCGILYAEDLSVTEMQDTGWISITEMQDAESIPIAEKENTDSVTDKADPCDTEISFVEDQTGEPECGETQSEEFQPENVDLQQKITEASGNSLRAGVGAALLDLQERAQIIVGDETYELMPQDAFYCWVYDANSNLVASYGTWANGGFRDDYLTDAYVYTDADGRVWCLIPVADLLADSIHYAQPQAYLDDYSFDPEDTGQCPFVFAPDAAATGGDKVRAEYVCVDDSWYVRVYDATAAGGTNEGGIYRSNLYYRPLPKIVSGAQPAHTSIDLFDYWVADDRYARDTWEADNHFYGGINAGHTLKFSVNGTNFAGTGQALYGQPYNYWTGTVQPYEGIVEKRLVDGYPYVAASIPSLTGGSALAAQAESLAYLFDPADAQEGSGRAAYHNVGGLFQLDDDGYYYYDSKRNFAEFDEASNAFVLYEEPAVGGGNFFPFNSIDGLTQSTANTDARLNHYFGLALTTTLFQKHGGKTAGNSYSLDTEFEFAGDDDVWIFMDGVLVTDLGGIHNASSVRINFATGEIVVNADTAYEKRSTLREQYAAADAADLTDWEDDTFADGTDHTLKLFYLERGNSASNLYLHYNIKEVPETEIYKVDQYGEPMPDVEFGAYAAECVVGQSDEDATRKATGKTSEMRIATDARMEAESYTYYYKYDSDVIGQSDAGALAQDADFLLEYDTDNPTQLSGILEKAESVCRKIADGTYTVDEATGAIVQDGNVLISVQYLGRTDETGRMLFEQEDGSYYSLHHLKMMFGEAFILREIAVPERHRQVAQDVHLRFGAGDILFCDNTYDSGVWTSPNMLVDAPNTIYRYRADGVEADDAIVYGTYDRATDEWTANGTIFGIVLKYVGDAETHDSYSTDGWVPIYGSSETGYTLIPTDGSQQQFLTAAIEAAENTIANGFADPVFRITEGGTIQMHMTNLPGSIGTYDDMLPEEDKGHAAYTVAYFWTSASGLAGADANNTVRILGEPATLSDGTEYAGFTYTYGAEIEVPNLTNELFVQKHDAAGQPVNGARFALYRVREEQENDRSKKEGAYESRISYLTQTELVATNESGAYGTGDADYLDDVEIVLGPRQAGGTGQAWVHGSDEAYEYQISETDGVITVLQADFMEILVGNVVGYQITPIEVEDTLPADDAHNLDAEDGTATFTDLAQGTYYVREVGAPAGYTINPTEIMVLVTDEVIYANAGTSDDGVAVARGPGRVVSTLTEFAIEGNVDNTLTWIYDMLKVNTAQGGTFHIDDPSSALWTYVVRQSGDTASAEHMDSSTEERSKNTVRTIHDSDVSGMATDNTLDASNVVAGKAANVSNMTGIMLADGIADREDDPLRTYLRYDNVSGSGQFAYVPNTQTHDPDEGAGTYMLATDEGWSYLEIYQDASAYEAKRTEVEASGNRITYDYTMLDDAITSLYSRTVYVQVTDEVLWNLPSTGARGGIYLPIVAGVVLVVAGGGVLILVIGSGRKPKAHGRKRTG